MATATQHIPTQPGTSEVLDLIGELFDGVEPACAVRLPDGTTWSPPGRAARFTIVVRNDAGLRDLLSARDEAAMADAYLRDDLDIEGDLFAVPSVARAILAKHRSLRQKVSLAVKFARLPENARKGWRTPRARLRGTQHRVKRDRAAVTHHYDVSNDFYQLFLDESMTYTCAMFSRPDEDLAVAQERKNDMICRKLRLQPGERFLDVGCGWGSLIMHAARRFGARAVGITISEPQAQLARERIAAAGLSEQCEVRILDYRALPQDGSFDKAASVGMFEHVGSAQAGAFFRSLFGALRAGGAYLHHAIAGNPLTPPTSNETLNQRYVFPDTELIPIAQVLNVAGMCGFEVRDLENLREHYALTLRRWIAALEARHAAAVAQVGEATYRAWRLLFAGAADCFETNQQSLMQVLLVKPHGDGRAELPLLRTDWYQAR